MIIARNHETKKLVICLPRNASTRLEDIINQNKNWKKLSDTHQVQLHRSLGYKVYGSIRHPVERFCSWYGNFILDKPHTYNQHRVFSDPYGWNEEDIENFFELFKFTMHYDEHTQFQMMQYESLNISLDKIKFFDFKKLDKIMEVQHDYDVIYRTTWNRYKDEVSPGVSEKIIQCATEVYKHDIIWYEKIMEKNLKNG